MLYSRGVSLELEKIYEKYKDLCSQFYNKFGPFKSETELFREKNLYNHIPPGTIAYLQEGFLKLKKENKELRMYSNGDFIEILDFHQQQYTLSGDFKSELTYILIDDFLNILSNNEQALKGWTQIKHYEDRLAMGLCSEFAPELVEFDMVVKNFSKGDVIIEQGHESREVFEMVTGSAEVSINGIVVGTIEKNELFGELGLLVDNVRQATVTAQKNCFVRVLDPHAFNALLETNNQFSVSLLKNLARRINAMNNALLQKNDLST